MSSSTTNELRLLIGRYESAREHESARTPRPARTTARGDRRARERFSQLGRASLGRELAALDRSGEVCSHLCTGCLLAALLFCSACVAALAGDRCFNSFQELMPRAQACSSTAVRAARRRLETKPVVRVSSAPRRASVRRPSQRYIRSTWPGKPPAAIHARGCPPKSVPLSPSK